MAEARAALRGRVAVVTGGNVGIGRATSRALAFAGASVVVTGRNEATVSETVEELADLTGRGDHLGRCFDVRDGQGGAEMAARVLERFGRIDILVAAAGVLRPRGGSLKTLRQMSVAEWDEVVDTNLTGTFLTTRAVLPAMIRQRKGDIVHVSSTSGRRGLAYDAAYCASKFGVIGLTESLAEEVRQYGIRVQVLLPGAIDTPMWEQNGPIPKPREALPPERVADAIITLLTLPEDTMLQSPVIQPFSGPTRPEWLAAHRGAHAIARAATPSTRP